MHVDIHAAKVHLSRLIDQVDAGEEIVISRHGRPVARLVPAAAAQPRKPGLLEGKGCWIAEDFDGPLPDDLLDLFEGKRNRKRKSLEAAPGHSSPRLVSDRPQANSGAIDGSPDRSGQYAAITRPRQP
jgi:prevent-host-death family protein